MTAEVVRGGRDSKGRRYPSRRTSTTQVSAPKRCQVAQWRDRHPPTTGSRRGGTPPLASSSLLLSPACPPLGRWRKGTSPSLGRVGRRLGTLALLRRLGLTSRRRGVATRTRGFGCSGSRRRGLHHCLVDKAVVLLRPTPFHRSTNFLLRKEEVRPKERSVAERQQTLRVQRA